MLSFYKDTLDKNTVEHSRGLSFYFLYSVFESIFGLEYHCDQELYILTKQGPVNNQRGGIFFLKTRWRELTGCFFPQNSSMTFFRKGLKLIRLFDMIVIPNLWEILT